MIRASAPYTSGWGSFVLLKMDRVMVAQGGSLSMLHWLTSCLNLRITRKPYGFMQSSFWVIMMVHVMVCGDL